MDELSAVRADQWLWAARFYKTRRLAREALSGGKVEVNGARAKPSKLVKPDDVMHIQKGEWHFEITVVALAKQRGPAKQAATLYVESEASQAARTKQRQMRKLMRPVKPEKSPDKTARRKLRALKQHGDWD